MTDKTNYGVFPPTEPGENDENYREALRQYESNAGDDPVQLHFAATTARAMAGRAGDSDFFMDKADEIWDKAIELAEKEGDSKYVSNLKEWKGRKGKKTIASKVAVASGLILGGFGLSNVSANLTGKVVDSGAGGFSNYLSLIFLILGVVGAYFYFLKR
jgi:hypothetical protein